MDNKWRSIPPEQTLQNINKILYKNNLLTNTVWHNKIYNNQFNMHSCSIKFIEDIGLQSNGKGVTPYFAEASGKAEFLERLQTYALTQREIDRIYFADEKIVNNQVEAPLLNLYTSEVEYLNDFTCGTTGMASGNTYEEAIVHAICEINERYCYWLLANQALKIHKEIIVKNFNISQFEMYYNGSIHFYDISLCKLPTILMMFLRNDNTVSISIDCAPTQELAIERCFTELFQGIDLQNKNPKCFSLITNKNCSPKVLYYSLVDLKISILPVSLINYILFSEYTNKLHTFQNFRNNRDLIQIYLKESSQIFNKLLIRDYSYLGFPSIKIIYQPNFEDSLDKYIPNVLSFYCDNFIEYHNFELTELFRNNLAFIDSKLSWNYQNYNKLRNSLREKSLTFKMDMEYFKQFCLKKED